MVRTLISRSSLIIALYWERPDAACESHSHHALMKAFADRDTVAAEEIQKSHIIDLHSGLNLKEHRQQDVSLKDLLNGR